MVLTLVPQALAQVGAGFGFAGPNRGEECRDCPFQRLCFGLRPGRGYEVTALRGVSHPCALHEGGRAHVVEVAEAPFATSLESRLLRGTAATWAPVPCGMPECANYALCHPARPPGRHQILETAGPLACPAGYDLQRVRFKPLE